MKKIISITLGILICFILQSTLFSTVNIGGVVPNLLIILTASIGFMEGEKYGMLTGLACGLFTDIFCSSFIGFYCLLFMYIGYTNGKLNLYFYPDDLKLPYGSIIVSDLIYGIASYVFLFLLRGRFEFGYYLGHIIFPELIATILISFLLYPVIVLIHKKLGTDTRVL